MISSEGYILSHIFATVIIAVLFAAVLAVLAGIWPNNTALYLSVLVWPAGLLAIISAPIATINAYKEDPTYLLDDWALLAIASGGFTVAAIVVLNTVNVLIDNPHLLWN